MFLCNVAIAQDQCAPVGWATENGGTTGGGNATPVTVTSASELQNELNSGDPKVIYVDGSIGSGVGTRISIEENDKTIFGMPGATLNGGFDVEANNIIIRNLIIQGPGAEDVDGVDCITLQKSATNVWMDHLDIRDGQDGNMDITNGSNYVSVTWTKFSYTSRSSDHQYCMLIGNSASKTSDRGKLKTTLQYNFFGEGVVERMPRVRFGQVHVVNNLFDNDVSNYAIRAGREADILVESNVFNGIDDPFDLHNGDYTAIEERNNIFNNTTGDQDDDGTAFTPPYSLNITDVNNVESIIRAGVGATLTAMDCGNTNENESPQVEITSPQQNTTFQAPADIMIEASASDNDGSVSRVEFFNGNNKLGEDNSSGYSFIWNDVAEGSYDLTAVAYDDEGASTTSSVITIVVEASGDTDCNGDVGGSAYIDDCGQCVGGNTGQSPCEPGGSCDANNPSYGIMGFATLNGGTTGGTGGDEVTVSTGEELQNAISDKSSGPLTIYVDGVINQSNSPGLSKIDIKDVSDISIIGVCDRGEMDGIGIKIWRASNIIIQNMTIHHVNIGDGDCIGIEGPSDHVWVDHCELYNEYEGVDKDYYDGLLDAKGEVDYITYSWNYLHDSWKAALSGSSDGDEHDRRITYHHNRFENINSRLPLFRFGSAHIFNNYYKDVASTAINSRMGACVKIENNHFENVNNPYVSAYSDEDGYGDISGNELINSPFSFSGDTRELMSCTANIPYDYDNYLNCVDVVPSMVTAYSGVGVINSCDGGGTQYTLTTSTEGNGTISSTPDQTTFDEGSTVSLTAVPEEGYVFDGWTGDVVSNDNPVIITMNSDISIVANFVQEEPDTYTLTIATEGSGTVTTDPDKETYDQFETVQATAEAADGWAFTGWTGDYTGTDNPAWITLDVSKSVTAVFELLPFDGVMIDVPDVCTFEGEVETEHAGYQGSGYVNFTNETGSSMLFVLNAESAQNNVELTLQYANGTDANRPMDVWVNGTDMNTTVDFTGTGDWANWEYQSVVVDLRAGNNAIELTSLENEGGPNIAFIGFENEAVSIGSCEPDCNDEVGGNAFIDSCGTCAGGSTGIEPITEEDGCVTGLSSTEVPSPECYPNPFNEQFTIEFNGSFDYAVFNAKGVIVDEGSATHSARISNTLEKGMYMVRVQYADGKYFHKKLIKQ